METQIWLPPSSAQWGGEGLNEGRVTSASTSVWEKVAPLALALKPDNLDPLHIFLVPIKLLLHCWSSE